MRNLFLDKMTFLGTIKQIRQKHFLWQEAFAKELDISLIIVDRWKSGKTESIYKTMKLLDYYCKKSGLAFDIGIECLEVEE